MGGGSDPAPLLLHSNTEPAHAWGGSQRTRTPRGASWLTADCCLKPRWWAPVLVTAPPLLGGPLRPLQSPYRVATPPPSPTQGVSYHLRKPRLWSLGRATLSPGWVSPHARLRVEAHSAAQPPSHPFLPPMAPITAPRGRRSRLHVDAPAQQGSPSLPVLPAGCTPHPTPRGDSGPAPSTPSWRANSALQAHEVQTRRRQRRTEGHHTEPAAWAGHPGAGAGLGDAAGPRPPRARGMAASQQQRAEQTHPCAGQASTGVGQARPGGAASHTDPVSRPHPPGLVDTGAAHLPPGPAAAPDSPARV